MGVAKAPGSCGVNKQLNRDWAFQIKPKGADPAAWQFVVGIKSISVNVETSTVDASDIDSGGWESVIKTSRKFMISAEGKYAKLFDATDLAPSIKLLVETGRRLGADGELDVRVWRTDGSVEAYEATVSVKFTDKGGDANALREYSVELQSVCAPRDILPVEEGGELGESVPLSERPKKPWKTLTLPSGLTGGTFTITVGSETTKPIKHNVNSKQLQAALAALEGVTDTVVAGDNPNFVIEYQGDSTFTASGTSLVGDSKTITVA